MARAASHKIEELNPRVTIKHFREAIIAAHPKNATRVVFRHPAISNLVSVIIPVYNDAVGLARTLASLERQLDAPKFEIIFEHDEHREGSYRTRNQAVSRSKGAYIAFIDAGSIAAPDWLKEGYTSLQKHDYVGGPINREIHLGKKVGSLAKLFGLHREFAVREFFEGAHFFPTTNLWVKRRVIDDLGGFDKRLLSSGDREFGERIFRHGRFKQYYSESVIVTHPFRSYRALLNKQRRIAKGNVDLARLHPTRFSLNLLASLGLLLIPPLWLLSKPSFKQLSLSEKIKISVITYHLSIVHHATIIRYGFLRAR
jgi:glycosyltransferase AglI